MLLHPYLWMLVHIPCGRMGWAEWQVGATCSPRVTKTLLSLAGMRNTGRKGADERHRGSCERPKDRVKCFAYCAGAMQLCGDDPGVWAVQKVLCDEVVSYQGMVWAAAALDFT